MDQHLSALATQHLETKFLKIDAEKAPFFSTKLNVQVIRALSLLPPFLAPLTCSILTPGCFIN